MFHLFGPVEMAHIAEWSLVLIKKVTLESSKFYSFCSFNVIEWRHFNSNTHHRE